MTTKVSRFAVNPDLIDEDDPCECGKPDCPEALEVLTDALGKLAKDEHLQLFYLSQGDQLSKDQVEQIFQGDVAGVEDYILTWWSDNDHYAIDYEVEQLVDSDEKELLENHDLLDQLKDAIREKDQSDPFGELAGATDDVWARVWICDVSDDCWDDPEVFDWEIASICSTGGLRRDLNEPTIRKFLQENQCAGEVCLLFRATVKDLITHVFGAHEWGSMPADPKLRILNPKLWVDGYAVDLQGQSSAVLNMATDPRLDTDYHHDRYMTPDTWEVVGRFDEYRQELLAFMEYRQKLMERA